MTEFTSEVKTIPHGVVDIYAVLSDLTNLELVKDKIPADKVKNFSFDRDSCTVNVSPVGDVKFQIIDRIENDTIKFQGMQLPMEIYMWIQLKESAEKETKLKLTIKADLNVFIKPMVSKPLTEGIEKVAEMLAMFPYDEIVAKRANLE